MRMLRASMALGTISAMALVSALPGRKLTKEFLESEIKEVQYQRLSGTVTHCTIVTKSGFTFTGESACVDPNNYNKELGEKYAYENAFEKMWMPYGFWLHKALAEYDYRLQPPSDDSKIEAQNWMIPDNATFDFGTAVEALKQGARVAREGWNGKGMFLSLVKGRDTDYHVNSEVFGTGNDGNSQDQLPVLDAIYMKTADNKLVPWLASQTDVLAEDWQIVE